MPSTQQQPEFSLEQMVSEFNKSSPTNQSKMKLFAMIGVIRESKLDPAILADALWASVNLMVVEAYAHAYERAARCHAETNLPMNAIVGTMGLEYFKQADKATERVRNFVDLLKAESPEPEQSSASGA